MPSDYFSFKQFKIFHNRCAMKVGTDGVLLGAWSNIDQAATVLDIGAGSGLIAIMLAQRTNNAIIDAIEIESEAFNQAVENSKNCPWSNRLRIFHTSLQEYSLSSGLKYDLIVSNPPFFLNSLKSPAGKRSVARHNISLTREELLTGVKHLLNSKGRFCLIIPANESQSFIEMASSFDLYCNKVTIVRPKPQSVPKRVLLEMGCNFTETIKSELVIELEKRHHYSDDFKKLTESFYLYFKL